MKILVVVDHPERHAFARRLAERFAAGAAEAGHEVTLADLHEEGFDPRMRPEDLAFYRGTGPRPPGIGKEQERVDAADALVLVFPLYWWSMPALMKGWIDRVFTGGWAYGNGEDGKVRGLMTDRPVLLLMTAGSDAAGLDRHGYRDAMLAQMVRGIFGYCGIRDVRPVWFHDVESPDAAIRRDHLEAAGRLGTAFPEAGSGAADALAGAGR
jgi:NAD(P)H dehydrogenase (quinone)